jgi:hypothetical protein
MNMAQAAVGRMVEAQPGQDELQWRVHPHGVMARTLTSSGHSGDSMHFWHRSEVLDVRITDWDPKYGCHAKPERPLSCMPHRTTLPYSSSVMEDIGD